MQVGVLLGAVALCAAPFSSSGGILAEDSNEDTNPERTTATFLPYTLEEEMFIIAQLESIPGRCTASVWDDIAKEHKKMRDSNSEGFNHDRTPEGLRIRFTRFMAKDKGLVKVPQSIKDKFRKSRFNYHPEEDKLINEYLLAYTGTSFNNIELWKDIEKAHELRRESKAFGFNQKRTARGLLSHFYHFMKPKGLLTLAVMRKFPTLFIQRRKSKRSAKAKKESGCSQDTVKNDDENLNIVQNDEENFDTVQNEEENLDTVQTDEDNWAAPLLEAMEYLSDFTENEEDWGGDDSTDI